ncbi:hypothetical protein K9E39_01350 [Gardnerella vaginalis]|uniref:hypothetical protein n=1 Tax=Actinomycetes TaxID=1760 RepID=UPI0014703A7A|nr:MULTISPECIES: hypothetical protein [Actinomycetes]NMX20032.1 hypothetical protein [Mobiluncus mulieris]UQA78953.1 hypothetical protein K9E45_01685 [Gardnerella vaginalis]UQA79506.1 hypothetical protein K9E44_04960 [Gardnerella vaginalis]UQA81220.1 hypothetical protein K9E43_01310 [Gardnerella piotii]UQA82381.1 hypothetical protein K9E42_01160 [Gardnerella vaginalis]
MTPVNHVANIRQIFVNLRQDLKSLQAEIEATENDLLHWMESGIEADYMLTDEPDSTEPPQPEPVSESHPQVKLLPLEEVRGVLADYARSGLNDFIKAKIRSFEHTKLSQLTVEQANAVLAAAKAEAGGA